MTPIPQEEETPAFTLRERIADLAGLYRGRAVTQYSPSARDAYDDVASALEFALAQPSPDGGGEEAAKAFAKSHADAHFTGGSSTNRHSQECLVVAFLAGIAHARGEK